MKGRYVDHRAVLKNWILMGSEDFYYLIGDVKNHTTLPDGDIRTSQIEWIDFKTKEAQTKNTLYSLGRPAGGSRCVTDSIRIVE